MFHHLTSQPRSRLDRALVRTRWALAVCVVCGHEQARKNAPDLATCPTCGATVHAFPLYRQLDAHPRP
jgi:rubrerythrin